MPGQSYHPIIIAEVPTDASCVERTLCHQDLGSGPLGLSFCNNYRSIRSRSRQSKLFTLDYRSDRPPFLLRNDSAPEIILLC